MGTFATPDHKSRADAASWAARRLQDGANRDQILLELRQDGVSPADAEDVYGRVRTSLRSLSVPRVGVLVRVAALLLPTVALGGWLWSMVKLGPRSDEGYFAAVMTAMLVAVAIGTMTALATVL
ncbi:MAG: hypothetical protein QOE29_75, partial [Gaiellaceae bacterium]|nr:hypothetical protein [Gaiellaceae bacterium]